MKKKLRKIIVFLILTASAKAQWSPYTGIGAGFSYSQNILTAKYEDRLIIGEQKINMSKGGIAETILLGLRKQNDHFFFASEIFGSLHQMKKIKKGNAYFIVNFADGRGNPVLLDFELDQKCSGGFSFLIGKDLFPTIDVFLKADVFWTKFTLKYTNPRSTLSGQENKWVVGYAPGIGLQAKLTPNLSTRFDYTYKIYQRFKTQNISKETFLRGSTITGNIHPRVHQFMVSLIYTF